MKSDIELEYRYTALMELLLCLRSASDAKDIWDNIVFTLVPNERRHHELNVDNSVHRGNRSTP